MIPFVTEFLSWIANTDIVGGNLFVGNLRAADLERLVRQASRLTERSWRTQPSS